MEKGWCEVCGNGFKSSAYWFKMKRTDFPVKCGGCRKEAREKMRDNLEKRGKSRK
jgi:hypothetical protein